MTIIGQGKIRRDAAFRLKELRAKLHAKYDAAEKRVMDDVVDLLLGPLHLPPEGWVAMESADDRVVYERERKGGGIGAKS